MSEKTKNDVVALMVGAALALLVLLAILQAARHFHGHH
jgi:hypothetical protein